LLVAVTLPGQYPAQTILNVGLNDRTVAGLARQACGDERFAWAAYCRLIWALGTVVFAVPGVAFEEAFRSCCGSIWKTSQPGTRQESGRWRRLVSKFSGRMPDESFPRTLASNWT
jgi:pyruvate, orthophosphate dikinase